jgi:Uma2 family endonuclease
MMYKLAARDSDISTGRRSVSSSTATTKAAHPPIGAGNGPGAAEGASPIGVCDDLLYEVVGGKVVEKTVGVFEVGIAGILMVQLDTFGKAHRLGRAFMEMIFRIDPATDLQPRPDVAFVSHAKWPVNRRPPKTAAWDLVPDLAVEVVSPSNRADTVQEKTHEYFKAGVKQAWVVYPRQQEVYVYSAPAEVQILQIGQELDGGDVIPGFRLPLTALFEDDAE